MGPPETTLEMARRHVAEGEARCARQAELVQEMISDNHPAAAAAAERLLATLERTLATMREHLQLEEAQHGQGGAGA